MPAPTTPYQPYAGVHDKPNGPGDARPTAIDIVKDCNCEGKLTERKILITGCSSGIGIETARALYETGAALFLTARDTPKLERVIDDIVAGSDSKGFPRPSAIEMRLDSLTSVREGAEVVKERSGGKLDMLINNAGVMAAPYALTEDGIETQLGICHMAHFLLFKLMQPLLLKSAKENGTTSRVIDLSSAGHRLTGIHFDNPNFTESTYDSWQAYGQAKTANILMTNAITRYYGSAGITGLSVHPGGITSTGLFKHIDTSDLEAFGDVDTMQRTFKSVEQGAATTVWGAVSPYFEDVKNGGVLLGDVGVSKPAKEDDAFDAASYAPHAYDEQSEDKLWNISLEMVGMGGD